MREAGAFGRLALLASASEAAQEAQQRLAGDHDWCSLEEADAAVVLGGDGFMLQVLHQMIDADRVIPVYGLNLGTVGFLMNRYRGGRGIHSRIRRARGFSFAPLRMEAVRHDGTVESHCAINEVSLLRETRQTAKIEVKVNDKIRIAELACDGVLLSTPAGSTAYNLSANGPILPLDSKMLALTPISPFRPRRWRGALIPNKAQISISALEHEKRPVSAVADAAEMRHVVRVDIEQARTVDLFMMFDTGHNLDERILAEQFRY